MEIGEIMEGTETFFMALGLLIVLPPVFIYRFIKFLRE